jgi:hypothetical protein
VMIVSKRHLRRHQGRAPVNVGRVAGGCVLGFEMGVSDASALLHGGRHEDAVVDHSSASCIVGLATVPLQCKNVRAMRSGCKHAVLDLGLGRSNNTPPHRGEK